MLIFVLGLQIFFACFSIPVLSPSAQVQIPPREHSTVERLAVARLASVQQDRLSLQRARKTLRPPRGFRDYRAILHVHAEDSAHTGGTRPELLAACKRADVKIVMLTNHWRPPVDFVTHSWRGVRDGVLFIPGTEYEGFLGYPQSSIISRKYQGREGFITLVKENGGDIFLSHIEERTDWPTQALTGMEIYNHHADFKTELGFLQWLQRTVSDLNGIELLHELLQLYPQEFFAAQQDYLSQYIKKWDQDLLTHRVTGIAANDCHHNQVLTVKVGANQTVELWLTGDKSASFIVNTTQAPQIPALVQGKSVGDIIAQFDLDPYERSLRYVTTHILSRSLQEESVRKALRESRAYVAHDWICDPTGFSFTVQRGQRFVGIMGDEIQLQPNMRFDVVVPVPAQLKLIRNGIVLQEIQSDQMHAEITTAGIYRVEAWAKLDGEYRPWIYSNPIRIK